MTKAMTAAQKDQLLAEAKAVGLYVTRTSTDFHLITNDGKRRVTPGEIRRLIVEAEELGRDEAFQAAAEIRAELEATAEQGEPDTLEDALETALDGAATPAPEGEKSWRCPPPPQSPSRRPQHPPRPARRRPPRSNAPRNPRPTRPTSPPAR